MGLRTRGKTFDAELLLNDAGAITSNSAGTVGGSPQVIDIRPEDGIGDGGEGPEVKGWFMVDVSSIETGTGDESYEIILQGSNTSDFSGDVEELSVIRLGAGSGLPTGSNVVSVADRYGNMFSNWRGGEGQGQVYPYLRAFAVVNGTISTGIDFTAWLAMQA